MSVKKLFPIALDVKRSTSLREIEVVEGDNGNVLEITLTDDDTAVDLTGCLVSAAFAKPNGTTAQQDNNGNGITMDTAHSNKFSIELYTTSFSPGLVECEIQVFSGADQQVLITTAKFNFSCRRGIANADTIPATPEWPILVDMIASCENVEAAEAVRITAEDGRAAAEAGRIAAEEGRVAAETAREALKQKILNPSATAVSLSVGDAPTAVAQLTNNGIAFSFGLVPGNPAAVHAGQHSQTGTDPLSPASIGAQPKMQYAVMPAAAAESLGQVVQYVGESTPSYTNGALYQVIADPSIVVAGPPRCLWAALPFACNQNYIDNWDFRNPVNQRGGNMFASITNDYIPCIDRWSFRAGSVSLTDGGMRLTGRLKTVLEHARRFVGACTLSIEIDGVIYSASGILPSATPGSTMIASWMTGLFSNGVGYDMRVSAPSTVVSGEDRTQCEVEFTIPAGENMLLSRVKLERGYFSTLREDTVSNYAAELVKCQRYALAFSKLTRIRATMVLTNRIDFFIPVPVTPCANATPSIELNNMTILSMAGAAVSGFTISVQSATENGIIVNATKTAHGLPDAVLQVSSGGSGNIRTVFSFGL